MNVWWCDQNKHTVKCFSGMITYIVDARIQICRQISVSEKDLSALSETLPSLWVPTFSCSFWILTPS